MIATIEIYAKETYNEVDLKQPKGGRDMDIIGLADLFRRLTRSGQLNPSLERGILQEMRKFSFHERIQCLFGSGEEGEPLRQKLWEQICQGASYIPDEDILVLVMAYKDGDPIPEALLARLRDHSVEEWISMLEASKPLDGDLETASSFFRSFRS